MTLQEITEEITEALHDADARASVKILIKDYADGWYEAPVGVRLSVDDLNAVAEAVSSSFVGKM